jgi:putative transposase
MTVARFVARLDIPRATWYYWRTAAGTGRQVTRWPTPVIDGIAEAVAEKKSTEHGSAWGHRKIWGMLRADGYHVSQSSVKRALAAQGLLLPVRYQAERRALGQARRALFTAPPTRRNRVWQTDFSEYETAGGGNWQLSGVVDYVAKICLTCPATPTQTARDAVTAIEAAIAQAEAFLGVSMLQECTDPDTGEIQPLTVVSDNGPAYKSDRFAKFVRAHAPWLRHVRTRYRSPQSNGVIERFNESIKYEHLFRYEIPNGYELNIETEHYRHIYNNIRPHEHLDFLTPTQVYLADPPPTPPAEANLSHQQTVQKP